MSTALATEHRTNQARLSTLLLADLRAIYRGTILVAGLGAFSPDDPAVARTVEQAAAIIDRHRSASSALAATFYRAARVAAGLPATARPFRPVLAKPAPLEQVSRSLRWAAGTEQGGREPDAAATLLDGVGRRLVLNGGRETIVESVEADPVADRYARITSPGCCSFCALVATRGAVYHSEETAGKYRGYHNSCRCSVTPVFKGQDYDMPEHIREADALYAESTAGINGTAKLRAFRAAWEARERAAARPAA